MEHGAVCGTAVKPVVIETGQLPSYSTTEPNAKVLGVERMKLDKRELRAEAGERQDRASEVGTED